MQSEASYTAKDIIAMFAMERHPLAGWYALHYSDDETLGRPRLSSIAFLVTGDEPMPQHKLDGIHVWHHHAGAAAEFTVTNGGRVRETFVLGGDFALGQRPQLAVPAYFWQSCRSLGDWTLLGCTMMPGFSTRSTLTLAADD